MPDMDASNWSYVLWNSSKLLICFVFGNLTQLVLSKNRDLKKQYTSLRLTCRQACGTLYWLIIDVWGPIPLWVVSSLDRWTWVVLRNQFEHAIGYKPVSTISPWFLIQFLVSGSCLGSHRWWIMIWITNKPFSFPSWFCSWYFDITKESKLNNISPDLRDSFSLGNYFCTTKEGWNLKNETIFQQLWNMTALLDICLRDKNPLEFLQCQMESK